jgi:hypothetical protein
MRFLYHSLLLSALVTSCGMYVRQGHHDEIPTPPEAIALPASGCSQWIIDFTNLNYPDAAGTKTYVMFDLSADGRWTTAGNGGNGNIGHSAQIGASCCRPDAETQIAIVLPDDTKKHWMGLYALDSSGLGYDKGPFATFSVPAESRNACTAHFQAP